MFDGRESSAATDTTKILYNNYPDSLLSDLTHQAMDAINQHAQALTPRLRFQTLGSHKS